MSLSTRPKSECKYDLLSLGEIMLRLDPGEGRIRTAREFKAWEGGGEYNVARGLRRCFGLTTGVATAFADNEIGRLIEDFILAGRCGYIPHKMDSLRWPGQRSPERAKLYRAWLWDSWCRGRTRPRINRRKPVKTRRL